jgi:hypothetical protein
MCRGARDSDGYAFVSLSFRHGKKRVNFSHRMKVAAEPAVSPVAGPTQSMIQRNNYAGGTVLAISND